jgi:hypothetical protein
VFKEGPGCFYITETGTIQVDEDMQQLVSNYVPPTGKFAFTLMHDDCVRLLCPFHLASLSQTTFKSCSFTSSLVLSFPTSRVKSQVNRQSTNALMMMSR